MKRLVPVRADQGRCKRLVGCWRDHEFDSQLRGKSCFWHLLDDEQLQAIREARLREQQCQCEECKALGRPKTRQELIDDEDRYWKARVELWRTSRT